MYCTGCGIAQTNGAKFCQSCGKSVDLSNTSAPNISPTQASSAEGPYFWGASVLTFLIGSWFGSYGLFTLAKSNCDYVYWNGDSFPSYTDSFMCANGLESGIFQLVDLRTFGHIEFSFVMTLISVGFAFASWRLIRKARSFS